MGVGWSFKQRIFHYNSIKLVYRYIHGSMFYNMSLLQIMILASIALGVSVYGRLKISKWETKINEIIDDVQPKWKPRSVTIFHALSRELLCKPEWQMLNASVVKRLSINHSVSFTADSQILSFKVRTRQVQMFV